MQKLSIDVTVNGQRYNREVEARQLLVHFIRDTLELTGTHVGCETSLCGACTVLLDDKAVKACTVLAVQADGANITTVEGLAQNGQLHPLQEEIWEQHGLQCGFCTAGILMTSVQLLADNPQPSEDEIRQGLKGNYCRCTGYQNIVKAIQHAADKMQGSVAAD